MSRAPLSFFLLLVMCSCGCGGEPGSGDGGAADASGGSSDGGGPRDAGLDAGRAGGDGGGRDGGGRDGGGWDGGGWDAGWHLDAAAADGAAPDASSSADGGTPPAADCPLDGWCFLRPDPFAVELNDVWGSGPSDVWAVGRSGFIAHFDGAAWSVVASPTEATLDAVHGSAADDVWAVGEAGTLVHFDGVAWRAVSSPTDLALRDVWAAGPDDAWAVGADRVRLRFDGSSWVIYDTEPTYGDYTAVWGSASDDVWLGDARGGLSRWDGTQWNLSDFDWFWFQRLSDLWGSGPDDVWATFSSVEHQVAHFDGTEWSAIAVPTTPSSTFGVHAVGGRGPDDVWFFGESAKARWDGSEITVVESHPQHFVGGTWLSAGDGWAVGNGGQIWRLASAAAWALAAPDPNEGEWGPIVAWGNDDVWIAGSDGIERWTGAALQDGPAGFGGGGAMWGSSPTDVWSVTGRATLQRFDGTSVSTIELTGDLWDFRVTDIWGSGPNDVWLVGSDERIVHYDGSTFETVYGGGFSDYGTVEAIDGSGPNDVWAVDGDGQILRLDGGTWTVHAMTESPRVWWKSVIAIAPDDVWAGGGGATLWHYDGTDWTEVNAEGVSRGDRGNSPYVVGFAHQPGFDVHAITNEGHVLHFDGGAWRARRQLPLNLYSIAMEPNGTLWAAAASVPYGDAGNLLRRAP